MNVRTLLITAAVGAVSLLTLAPSALGTPSALPSHASSGGRVACVAVQTPDLGLCMGNPLKDLP